MDKPTCKVHGMVARNAMCGHIIVGMKYCGFSGDCQHKSVVEMLVNFVRTDAAKGPNNEPTENKP